MSETQVPRQAAVTDHSTGELVKQLTEQVSALVRDEMKLAQLELTRKGKQTGLGIGMLGGSGVVALYGVACLLACAIIGLSHVLQAWLAALIVGGALFLIAGVAAMAGRGRMKQGTPPVPTEAVESVKTDVAEIKERVKR
ncbi:MAG TPA: phage holin family protein [Trebonia sp.]|jgi:uncharacterized membrane protein YqjE|nr:phage holin family protein [Trebonia sp.]